MKIPYKEDQVKMIVSDIIIHRTPCGVKSKLLLVVIKEYVEESNDAVILDYSIHGKIYLSELKA